MSVKIHTVLFTRGPPLIVLVERDAFWLAVIFFSWQNDRTRWLIACAADRRSPSWPYNYSSFRVLYSWICSWFFWLFSWFFHDPFWNIARKIGKRYKYVCMHISSTNLSWCLTWFWPAHHFWDKLILWILIKYLNFY